jgi:hypothetical protein
MPAHFQPILVLTQSLSAWWTALHMGKKRKGFQKNDTLHKNRNAARRTSKFYDPAYLAAHGLSPVAHGLEFLDGPLPEPALEPAAVAVQSH